MGSRSQLRKPGASSPPGASSGGSRINGPDRVGWRWLLAVLFAALLYRGLCFSILRGHPLLAYPIVDAGFHDAWANRIVCGDWLGHGPDDVFKPPLYPYLLAVIYAVFGRQVHAAQWAQFLLGALSCVFVAILAGRLLGRTTGWVAGLISALYAPYVFFELQLLTPSVSVFLNLLAVLLLVTPANRPRAHLRDLGAGGVFGVSAGVRPDVVVAALLVVLLVIGRWDRSVWRRRIVRLLCVGAGLAVVVAPIAVRNRALTGQWIPISSNAGINFYVGNVASEDGTTAVPVGLRWERLVAQVPQRLLEKPASASRWWRQKTWAHIRSEPGNALAKLGTKTVAFLNRREFRNNISFHFLQDHCWPMRAPFVQFGLIVPLAGCGFVALWRRGVGGGRGASVLCGLWVAAYAVLGIVFFVTARFRLPAVPFLIVPAAWAVVQIVGLIRGREFKGLLAYGVGVLILVGLTWPMWLGSPEAGRVRDHVNLGNSLRAGGRHQEAADAYRRALDLSPRDPDANYLLARLLLPSAPAQALVHLETARQVLPDSPDLLLATGQAHMASRDRDQARRALESLIRLSETSNLWPKRAAWATAHIMLADLSPNQSRAHWDRAWSIDPRTAAEASFLRRRDLQRVLETFRAEAAAKTWDWYSQANHGLVLLELGRADEAVSALRRAVRLDPTREALKYQLARALLESGKTAEARGLLDEVDRLLPDCPLRRQVRKLRGRAATTSVPAGQ